MGHVSIFKGQPDPKDIVPGSLVFPIAPGILCNITPEHPLWLEILYLDLKTYKTKELRGMIEIMEKQPATAALPHFKAELARR